MQSTRKEDVTNTPEDVIIDALAEIHNWNGVGIGDRFVTIVNAASTITEYTEWTGGEAIMEYQQGTVFQVLEVRPVELAPDE